jgi:hypothetical protein
MEGCRWCSQIVLLCAPRQVDHGEMTTRGQDGPFCGGCSCEEDEEVVKRTRHSLQLHLVILDDGANRLGQHLCETLTDKCLFHIYNHHPLLIKAPSSPTPCSSYLAINKGFQYVLRMACLLFLRFRIAYFICGGVDPC